MTDIILLFCSILGGFLIGRYWEKRILLRHEVLSDLLKYVCELQANVTGRQWELAQFNQAFQENCSEPFREALEKGQSSHLLPKQQGRFKSFFRQLDCASSAQLLQHLELSQKQFEADLAESAAEVKRASVYTKLGLLLGAMVGILFL